MRFAVPALAAFILLYAATGHAQQLDPWQLVGHTTTTHLGGEGLRAFTLACQADFGPATRMCTSAEVRSTITWPTLTSEAWVLPTWTDVRGDAATGIQNVGDCSGWTSNGNQARGFLLSPIGAMGSTESQLGLEGFSQAPYCYTPQPVACCRRVPEPTASLMLPVGGLACLGLAKARS